MKTNATRTHRLLAVMVTGLLLSSLAAAASEPATTERLDPAQIPLGQSAQLTIASSGDSATPIAPPVVAGLEFVAVGQSSQIETVNGRTSSTNSVIYQVIPQRVGLYSIPGIARGSPALALQVLPGNSSAATTTGPSQNAGSAPPPLTASGLMAGATRMSADHAAFVRLSLPKHQLYVGESIPVQIQVGMRADSIGSLNGLPTLDGDAFTLSPLSAQPAQSEQIVDGNPFTVLTWRSVLTAVKPGALSLTVQTPLTIRTQASIPSLRDLLADSDFADVFNDPFLKNSLGATSEKDVTVISAPAGFTVLALPTQGRPANFSGAVGQFKVSSELSADAATAGDPLTLKLHVAGTGDFDRVNSAMLGRLDHWRTYQPTASFTPADDAGYRGEKSFAQPLIAEQSGTQTLPGIAFSYFDPQARRYESAQTLPLSVSVTPAPATSAIALSTTAAPIPAAIATPSSATLPVGLRTDHADTHAAATSWVPLYFQPRFVAIPSALSLAFALSWLWMRRRDLRSIDREKTRSLDASREISELLPQMERAARTGDVALFFNSARTALQRLLAARWQVPPASITEGDIEARLGAEGKELCRLFNLADEATFSGRHLEHVDFQKWIRTIRHEFTQRAAA